ncbi:MAG: magnesium transporter [Bacteroidia bacterium]|jgi:magnesium transporter
MSKLSHKYSIKAGLPPGTLIHVGKQNSDSVSISVMDYSLESFEQKKATDKIDCSPFKSPGTVSWINIDGLHNIKLMSNLGKQFKLHDLLLEDILNTNHRPNVEAYDDHVFLTLKMLGISPDGGDIVAEQVSFVLGDNWLLSFQEQEGDLFDSVRNRIKEGKGAIRKNGPDYLLYALVDTIVDNYFFVAEYFSEQTEIIEERVLTNSDQSALQEIQRLKKLLIQFRKSISPLREAISSLQKDNIAQVTPFTNRYLRDVYEHIIQVNDSIDSHRDLLASIMDLYMSGESNKMNKTMQVLTIIATIFIPMTFVAGIYGMNFDILPELHWKYGYLGFWSIMVVIIIIMVSFFRRRKWL